MLPKNIKRIVYALDRRGYLAWLSDKTYLKLMFRVNMDQKLNLKNPKTFSEKLQWLKLYDRKPEYTTMVDKCEVKKYVAEKIGQQYIIPTLGVWDKFNDIDFDALPDQFVLKCTHDSGGLVICRDKSKLDITVARAKIEKSLATDYYLRGREWPYKNVKPRIIAEKFMVDESGTELKDYKVMCFGGKAKLIQVHSERFGNRHARNMYDVNWELQDFRGYPLIAETPEKPECLEQMLQFSELLAEGIAHIRVDWYIVNGKLYFGELTFFDGSGLGKFEIEELDCTLGSWIELPPVTEER